MKATIRLFKALPIKVKTKKNPSKKLLSKTIEQGFIISPQVISNYPNQKNILKLIEDEIGLTGKELNQSFHKSWAKVKDADIRQLVIEQIMHYFTTYGYEELGVYDSDMVYIPNEKLDIPGLEEDIMLTVIKGYTKAELKVKLLDLLNSGIALKEETIDDVVEVAEFVKLSEAEIEGIKNKEVKIKLYDSLGLVPENPSEFLRYVVYEATNKTLLIKDKATINLIKSSNINVTTSLSRYDKKHGLEKLSEIFYRFKPIFLALRSNPKSKKIVNRIRRLAKENHKPMKKDYLNEVTSRIKSMSPKLTIKELKSELEKANTFRKIRLAYALKFRTKDVDSILYKIRNGKGYATEFSFEHKNVAKKVLKVVLDSIISDVKKNVKGKKVYLPDEINYALPATEKQFTGNFPSGTCVSIPSDMIVGVHWEDIESHRIDLDLALLSVDKKIGWDADYRTEGRDILFSGDVTVAPKPDGATELFYVRKQLKNPAILTLNYYNHRENIGVPFKIIVAKEAVSNFKNNYMVNPNNVISVANSKITEKQMVLGLIVPTTQGNKFYFSETIVGKNITSSNSAAVKNTRKYLLDFYSNSIELRDVLEKAGAKFVKDKKKCEIDLSPESLEKDTILKLLTIKK